MQKQFKEIGYIMHKTLSEEEPMRLMVVRDTLDRLTYDTDTFPRYCEVLYQTYLKVRERKDFEGFDDLAQRLYLLYETYDSDIDILDSIKIHKIVKTLY